MRQQNVRGVEGVQRQENVETGQKVFGGDQRRVTEREVDGGSTYYSGVAKIWTCVYIKRE